MDLGLGSDGMTEMMVAAGNAEEGVTEIGAMIEMGKAAIFSYILDRENNILKKAVFLCSYFLTVVMICK